MNIWFKQKSLDEFRTMLLKVLENSQKFSEDKAKKPCDEHPKNKGETTRVQEEKRISILS